MSFNFPSFSELIISTAALLTALYVIWQKGCKPLYTTLQTFASIPASISALEAQLKPNGGHSLRDVVNRIEANLLKSVERQKIFMGFTPHAVFETDDQGRFVYFNRNFLRWISRAESELLGENWINCIHHPDRDRVQQEWDRAIEGKRNFDMRFRVSSGEGDIFEVWLRAFPMLQAHLPGAGVSGWFGIASLEESHGHETKLSSHP